VFTLKPLFLVSGIITATSFILTVCTVNFARYDHRMYGIDDVRWKKGLSLFAMISGVVAGLGLILLAVMDTFRFHEEHAVLPLVCNCHNNRLFRPGMEPKYLSKIESVVSLESEISRSTTEFDAYGCLAVY
jgi:hypothetical protein